MTKILKQSIKTPNGDISFNLVKVKGGSFLMGSNQIKITVPTFYMAEFPVTQALWEAITGENPARFKGADRPVEQVSWNDIKGIDEGNSLDFLRKLNKITGREYRLPSESEWKYAAIGGHLAPQKDGVHYAGFEFAGSNRLEDVGWFDDNCNQETKDVGLKMPNQLGLYDMSGNVWELCEDGWHDDGVDGWHGEYGIDVPNDTPRDGKPWPSDSGSDRVYRGGSWFSYSLDCRVSFRNNWAPGYRYGRLGFRLVGVFQSVG